MIWNISETKRPARLESHVKLAPNHSQQGLTTLQIHSLYLGVSGSFHHLAGTKEILVEYHVMNLQQ